MLSFKFDANEVALQIQSNKQFLLSLPDQEQIIIEYWDENKTGQPTDIYLAQFLKKDKYNFIGVLDKVRFQRTSFGIERNQKDEVYVGFHENNLRHGRGVYHFPTKIEGDMELNSIYMGRWEKNMKNGAGSYIWRRDKKGQVSKYETCQITAFVGWFFDDKYDVGLFYEESGDGGITLYYGLFNDNNLKSDDEGFFYHNSNEETYVVVCVIRDDKVLEGSKFSFKHNENTNENLLVNFVSFKFSNGAHTNEKEGETVADMDNKVKEQYDKAQMFINILFKEEDFNKIYDAAINGEKTYQGIDTIEKFNEQYATVLKNYCAEGSIKIDDKLRQAFPKNGKFLPR